jgi:hypothetical protein
VQQTNTKNTKKRQEILEIVISHEWNEITEVKKPHKKCHKIHEFIIENIIAFSSLFFASANTTHAQLVMSFRLKQKRLKA